MPKIIIILIIIVVLVAGGFGIYKLIGSGEGEGGSGRGAGGSSSQILSEIRSETGIPFSSQTTVVFGWSTASGSETVFGSIFKASGVSASQASSVSSFLVSQGFTLNPLNDDGSYRGYQRGNLVCDIMNSGQQLEVSCGELP